MPQNTPLHEENDPVWKLLDHASEQSANDFFARDVMRAIRNEPSPQAWWQKLLTAKPALASLAAATAAVVISLNLLQTEQPASQPEPALVEAPTLEESFSELAADYDVPHDMDELITPIAFHTTSNDIDIVTSENLDAYLNL